MKSLRRDPDIGIVVPLLLLIILVGSLLRVPSLGHESLWFDELASWSRSHFADIGTVLLFIRRDVQSPGYEMLLSFVQKGLGDSEFALRFPSAMAGVLAIPMIYLLATQLYSYREGLIAAALTAVAWCPIYYSQEARAYSLLLLFSILTAYLWISMMRAFQKGDSPPYRTAGLYLAAATVCAYLHYFGLYLVGLQGLAAGAIFIRKPRALLKMAIIYMAFALLYLPWLPMMLEDLGKKEFWPEPPRISSFIFYLKFLFNKSTLLLAVAIGLYLYPLVQSLAAKRGNVLTVDPLSPGILLSLWLIIPFMGVFIKSIISTPALVFRYLIISLPPAYILLSRAITRLPFMVKTQIAIALISMGLFLGDLIFVKHYYSLPHKQQWREAVEYIVERDALYENSLIIGCAPTTDKQYFNYYFSRMNSPRRVDRIACRKQDLETVSVIDSKNSSYIWVIRLWFIGLKKPGRELLGFLELNFRRLEYKKFIGADVWLFEVIPP